MNNEFATLQKYVECYVGMWDYDIGIVGVNLLKNGIVIECGDASDEIRQIENQLSHLQVIKNVDIDVHVRHDNYTITILFDSNVLRVVGNVIRNNIGSLNKDNLTGFIQACMDDLSTISLELSFADYCNYDATIDWEVEFNTLFGETLLDILVDAKVITNEDRDKYN